MNGMTAFIVINVIAVAVIIYIFVIRPRSTPAWKARNLAAKTKERLRLAHPAAATVLAVRNIPQLAVIEGTNTMKVDLTLRVEPPQGQPYQALTSWAVENYALHRVSAGQSVPVKIDARDASVIYANIPWAQYHRGE